VGAEKKVDCTKSMDVYQKHGPSSEFPSLGDLRGSGVNPIVETRKAKG
jgi:hypothetical protein